MKRIKVCIRTKPTQNFAQDNLIIDREHNAIQVNKKVIYVYFMIFMHNVAFSLV